MKELGKIYVLSVLVITLMFLGVLIYKSAALENQPHLYFSLIFDLAFMVVPLVHYFLACRYTKLTASFSCIQIIYFNVLILEMSVYANTNATFNIVFKELPIILLCLISYD